MNVTERSVNVNYIIINCIHFKSQIKMSKLIQLFPSHVDLFCTATRHSESSESMQII
jgi:hypothetical protein